MIRNYLLIAWRNLQKNKLFSAINILGLAIGMAACLLIVQYASFELSYDDFHSKKEDIYRIRFDSYRNDVLEGSGVMCYYGAGPAIKQAFPEVKHFIRLHPADGMMSYQDEQGKSTSIHEKEAFYADSSFFNTFSYPLIKGSASSVLRNPNGMLLSATAAKKYFGEQNPVGKHIRLTTQWAGGDYLVEGVFADIPENSHLRFHFLFSIENLLANEQFKNGAWYWTNFYNYLLLQPGTDPAQLEAKLPGIIEKYLGKELRKFNSRQVFLLQPLTDIHLYSNVNGEVQANGDYKIVYLLIAISFIILSIAWLNYINLTTARAIERAKEVGIRKVMGSSKWNLIKQFLLESLLINMGACIIALTLIQLATPLYSELTGNKISGFAASQPYVWIGYFATFLIGALVSSFYPAFILSSFQPIRVLKGRLLSHSSGLQVRKLLTVCQFSASVLLIIVTLVVYQQVKFMQAQNLGMSIEQKLVIKAPKVISGESQQHVLDYFKTQALQQAAIQNLTFSSEVPGRAIFWGDEFKRVQDSEDNYKGYAILGIDEDFVSSFRITLLAGRNFIKDKTSDYNSILLNRTALRQFGFSSPESAINEEITKYGHPLRIIGVMEDFHQQSLKKKADPIIFRYMPWVNNYLTFTIQGTNVKQTIASIEEKYKQVFPGNAFEYFFLDEYYNQQYQAEDQFGKVFMIFSGLAIFVACMGLFGLASFATTQRTKEIGVRKVLGASVTGILVLLNKEFIKLIVIANLIAWPLAYWGISKWLENYAFRIEINPWLFVFPALLVLLIALLTVSFQTFKAARANPVKALRYE